MDYKDMLFCPLKRKHLVKQLKDKDISLDQIFSLSPTQLIYGSHIITECLKSDIGPEISEKATKIILNVVRRVIGKARDQNVVCPDFCSILKSCFTGLSVSNKRIPMQCKEICNAISTSSNVDFIEDVIIFIENYRIERANLLPILQFIMNHKILDSDIVDVALFGFDCFSGHTLDCWLNCSIKMLSDYNRSDNSLNITKTRGFTSTILDHCLSKLKQTGHSSHFIYIDTITQCVKYSEGISQEKASDILNINIDLCDGRGFGLSKVTLELNELLLKRYPDLIKNVYLIASGPFFSKCTHKYKGLWIKYCNISNIKNLDNSFVNTTLTKCLSMLHYNRINHDVIRTISILFEKAVRDDNYVMLLDTCLEHTRNPYPDTLRLIAVYILPLFYNTCRNTTRLDEFLAQTRDTREIAAFLYSYPADNLGPGPSSPCNLENYPAICDKLSSSGCPEIQSLWINTLSRHVLSQYTQHSTLPHTLLSALLKSLENICYIPCPSLRQQTFSFFKSLSTKCNITLKKQRKNDGKELTDELITLLHSIIKLFEVNIRIESSYHIKILSLTFFDIISKDGLLGHVTGHVTGHVKSHVTCDIEDNLKAILKWSSLDDSEVLVLSSRILSRFSQDVTDLIKLTSNIELYLTNPNLINALIKDIKHNNVDQELSGGLFRVLTKRLAFSITNGATDEASCISTQATMSILQQLVSHGLVLSGTLIIPVIEPLITFITNIMNIISCEIEYQLG